jgi:lysine-specific demethylase 8
MNSYQGPAFQLVDTISADELDAQGGFRPRPRPLLVKGAVKKWPAWEKWSFNSIADLKHKDGSEVVATFQNGLVEQGVTRQPVVQPVAPYLRELQAASAKIQAEWSADTGLCPDRLWKNLKTGEKFYLNWSHLQSFKPNRVYLAQWDILNEFPELKNDFAIRSIWKGWRWTWEYVFIGPSNTVTGLHYDFPNNWFCQVRGVKEFLLFPPENRAYMCESKKYDWGATLSDINISKLAEQPRESAAFAQANGLYARCEPGDALFVPKQTWHAVVALEPSISLAVFGLTLPEIILGGGPSEFRSLLHKMHLYRWGNCTCHKMDGTPK